MAKRRKAMSAAEYLAERIKDPEFLARQGHLEETEQANRITYQQAASPVLQDLTAAGFRVRTVGELRRVGAEYAAAVPILVRWLPAVDDRYVKEDIVRTLSVPWAKAAAQALLQEFQRLPDEDGIGLRWAIANALSVVADEDDFDEVAALAVDPTQGRAREMLVAALGNVHSDRAFELLRRLLDDDAVAGCAVMGLGNLGDPRAKPLVEPFINHPKKWVRDEAQKALKKLH
jgi:HEAT repeat protein